LPKAGQVGAAIAIRGAALLEEVEKVIITDFRLGNKVESEAQIFGIVQKLKRRSELKFSLQTSGEMACVYFKLLLLVLMKN
jgi:hypothetical protein